MNNQNFQVGCVFVEKTFGYPFFISMPRHIIPSLCNTVAANRVRHSFPTETTKYYFLFSSNLHLLYEIVAFLYGQNDFTIVLIGEHGSPLQMLPKFSAYCYFYITLQI